MNSMVYRINRKIRTYIHNWSLQPFSLDYWPSFSHHLCCVLILYKSGGTYSLKSTSNDRFFKKLFMVILFTLRVFDRNLLRGNRRRNTFRISFLCLAWDSNPDYSSNKPQHYLIDCVDYKHTAKAKFWTCWHEN